MFNLYQTTLGSRASYLKTASPGFRRLAVACTLITGIDLFQNAFQADQSSPQAEVRLPTPERLSSMLALPRSLSRSHGG